MSRKAREVFAEHFRLVAPEVQEHGLIGNIFKKEKRLYESIAERDKKRTEEDLAHLLQMVEEAAKGTPGVRAMKIYIHGLILQLLNEIEPGHPDFQVKVATGIAMFNTVEVLESTGEFYETLPFFVEKIDFLYHPERKETWQNPYISRVIAIIEEAVEGPVLTLRDVAEEIGISRTYLSSLFKREVGEGFITFLHRKKVEASLDDLLKTDMSIREVSDRYGYSSSTVFCRKFREIVGETPHQFRKYHLPRSFRKR